jgi:hypothetical protein
MADDWIKMRLNLPDDTRFLLLRAELGVTEGVALGLLWRVAAWFGKFGDHGALQIDAKLIDAYTDTPGLAAGMQRAGYLRERDGWLTLHRFCVPARRSLSKKEREAFIAQRGGRCERCGSFDRLEIDHHIPVKHGGRSTPGNLRLLCFDCNRTKGSALPESA